VVFPAPLMSTIEELGNFLTRERATGTLPPPSPAPAPVSAEVPAAVDQATNGAPAGGRA
jgi:hypothetical protein